MNENAWELISRYSCELLLEFWNIIIKTITLICIAFILLVFSDLLINSKEIEEISSLIVKSLDRYMLILEAVIIVSIISALINYYGVSSNFLYQVSVALTTSLYNIFTLLSALMIYIYFFVDDSLVGLLKILSIFGVFWFIGVLLYLSNFVVNENNKDSI